MEDPLARRPVHDELYPPWVDDMGHNLWNARNTKRRWPSERLGTAVVPMRNSMARSHSSANGSVWVLCEHPTLYPALNRGI